MILDIQEMVRSFISSLIGREFNKFDDARPQIPEKQWDVLGLGQAMVDFSGNVEDGVLQSLGLQKGARKIIGDEEIGDVFETVNCHESAVAAGGSLSNTLLALARLGMRSNGQPSLKVAMAAAVGNDKHGKLYREELEKENVNFVSQPIKDGSTGTVIVLTTPDAQRTMLSYQGMSSDIKCDSHLNDLISKSRILVIEGYLCEFPPAVDAIYQACEIAHKNNVLVAVTGGDVSCILKHHDKFWNIISNHAHIVFANSNEARALCSFNSTRSLEEAAKHLSLHSLLVSVTDGEMGSYIAARGEVVHIPPSPCVPIDTCGAGDAYAAGMLYGILLGSSCLKSIGSTASKVAAVVVGQQGTRLTEEDAIELRKCHQVYEKYYATFSCMHNHIGSYLSEPDKSQSTRYSML